jgi:hemerythrin-like domain-containing protein
MKTNEVLMEEHRNIEAVLDAWEAFADEISHAPVDDEKSWLNKFVRAIREYADAYHHGKEEEILFVAMVDSGFPREQGPIAVMLHEHDQGRALVGTLESMAQLSGEWSEKERAQIFDVIHNFSQLLRGHIQKEDQVLYPMAASQLPDEKKSQVDAAVDAFEIAQSENGRKTELLDGIRDLTERFLSD